VKTSFLRFHYLARANAATVVETMIHAMTKVQPHVNDNRVVVQTNDGASTMQGEHNGVQRNFCDQYALFVISIHCTTHNLNLSKKVLQLQTGSERTLFHNVRSLPSC